MDKATALKVLETAWKAHYEPSLFLRKAHGVSGPALYVGYDNADGKALGKASAVASELNRNGVSCFVDAVED